MTSLRSADSVGVVKLSAPPVGPGRVRLSSSLVACLKLSFSYRYINMQKASGEWYVFWYVGAKKGTHMMTTNNLSLKSRVLTEKDLDLPVGRNYRYRLAVLIMGLHKMRLSIYFGI